ncbi:MAG: RHS repeat-associated core domain-containing protein, partial [Blastocatellia bacterium]
MDYTYGVLNGSSLDTTKNNGNIQSETITAGTGQTPMIESFTYDSLNRLSNATENAGTAGGAINWSRTFKYDPFGNMWVQAFKVINPSSSTPTLQTQYDANANRLMLSPSAYDFSGNQTKDPSGNQIGYDAENRMTTFTASSGNMLAGYGYDGDGKRVSKQVTDASGNTTTTIFVYNAIGQLIADYGGGSTPATTGTRYLTTDHLGSTRVITDSTTPSPVVLERDDFLPFGEEIGNIGAGRNGVAGYSSSTDIRQKFTSKERDAESTLDYFGSRYYSGSGGRFTGADPNPVTQENFVNPQRWNLYVYVNNNPLASRDPNGADGNG